MCEGRDLKLVPPEKESVCGNPICAVAATTKNGFTTDAIFVAWQRVHTSTRTVTGSDGQQQLQATQICTTTGQRAATSTSTGLHVIIAGA